MQQTLNTKKRLTRYVVFASIVAFALAGCGSSDNEKEIIELAVEIQQGEAWAYSADLGNTPIATQTPRHGTLTLRSNEMRYTPEAAYHGTDRAEVEGAEAIYKIEWNIEYVNQPPKLLNTEIAVVSDREVSGQLMAEDPDGDSVQFELLAAPERGDFNLNEETGEFSYIQDELRLPNATFEVGLSDGVNDVVREVVTLLPAYTTNTEKAAYYYHSNHSHLLQAELRLAAITDDAETQQAYTNLAIGYVQANLPNEVERILSSYIVGLEPTAQAKRRVAAVLDELGEHDWAQELRYEALQSYTQFVVENNIENLTSSDSSFFLTLLNDAAAAGDFVNAERIAEQMQVFVDELCCGLYGTPYGRLSTAFRNQVNAAISRYQESGLEADRLEAITAAERFADVAARTGYQIVSNGENAGQRNFRLAPLYTIQSAEYFMILNEPEKAREWVAFTLSYYGDVNYDERYSTPAQPYAAVTRQEYLFPLVGASALFEILYPNAETNIPFSYIPDTDTFYSRAVAAIDNAKPTSELLTGGSLNDALAMLEAAHADSPRALFAGLSEASEWLWALNEHSFAEAMLDAAAAVLATDAFYTENRNSTLYSTGSRGCNQLIRQRITQQGRDNAFLDAQYCENTFISSGKFEENLTAHYDAINWFLFISDTDSAAQQHASDLLVAAENLLSELDSDARINATLNLATLAAKGRDYYPASDLVSQGLVEVDSYLNDALEEDKLAAIEFSLTALNKLDGLTYTTDGNAKAASYLSELRGHGYNEPVYQEWVTTTMQGIENILASVLVLTKALPAPEQADLAESIVERLSTNREYGKAESVLGELELSTTDRLLLSIFISELQSVQDDFTRSIIASVDTDFDGRANFFAVNATAEQQAQTDIQLDDDADGDEVLDDVDPCPLGC